MREVVHIMLQYKTNDTESAFETRCGVEIQVEGKKTVTRGKKRQEIRT